VYRHGAFLETDYQLMVDIGWRRYVTHPARSRFDWVDETKYLANGKMPDAIRLARIRLSAVGAATASKVQKAA
jgi:hypothetical protein